MYFNYLYFNYYTTLIFTQWSDEYRHQVTDVTTLLGISHSDAEFISYVTGIQ